MTRIGAAAVAVLAVAGCSSSPGASNDAAQPSSSRSPSASSTPTVSTWTLAEAGQQYLAMVKPNGAVASEINKLGSSDPISVWQKKMDEYASSMDVLARALLAGQWPASVQAQAQQVALDALAERAAIQMASSAGSVAALSSDLQGQVSVFTKAKTDSETMRIALGLPSN
jgi:hypothetical protein